jgi:hypothetical protein
MELGEGDVNADRMSLSLVGVPGFLLDLFDADDEIGVLRTLDDIELWPWVAKCLGISCEGCHFMAY